MSTEKMTPFQLSHMSTGKMTPFQDGMIPFSEEWCNPQGHLKEIQRTLMTKRRYIRPSKCCSNQSSIRQRNLDKVTKGIYLLLIAIYQRCISQKHWPLFPFYKLSYKSLLKSIYQILSPLIYRRLSSRFILFLDSVCVLHIKHNFRNTSYQ